MPMQQLYAARLNELGPGDFVLVQCGACGHDGLIHPARATVARAPLRRASGRFGTLAAVPRMRCQGESHRLRPLGGPSIVGGTIVNREAR
jgi:hypothetical protein